MTKQLLKQIALILVGIAKKGQGPCITYGELSKNLNNAITPRNLNKPLGELSDLAIKHGFPRISAIVVNKDTCFPGEGFFNEFAGGIPMNQWEIFWKQDVENIYACNNWDDFIKAIS